MNNKLTRPIVFFDLETTGISLTNDRIVEIAMTKIHPNGDKNSYNTLVNPTINIPQVVSEIHGITNEDVSDQDTFNYIAPEVFQFIDGCDLCGYNIIRFDVPLLLEEFLRAGILWEYKKHAIIDVFKLYAVIEPRTLSGTYKRFTGNPLVNAHSAIADTDATIEIFEKQIELYADLLPESISDYTQIKYPDEQKTLDLAGKFAVNETDVVFNFGKYRGKSVKEVYTTDANYFMWMIDKGDFSSETKSYARKIHTKLSTQILHK